ncbi:MAG: ImmA/IrrE family metallo-endopeptidase [Pseudomonadota bacterium]
MRKPDDSSLTPEQYRKVRAEAKRALNESGALGRFPTPVSDIMAAARVEEVEDDVLNPGFIAKMRQKAGDALKSALGKVIGLFDAGAKLVFIDRSLHVVKQTFVRLHEAAHGFMPWQSDLYAVVEDSKESLEPGVADLFDREANNFASEVLFQLDTFSEEAEGHEFGIKTPLKLSRKYGASVYATVRRYVFRNHRACAVVVLNPPELIEGDGFRATLRRVVQSPFFTEIFGQIEWADSFTPDDDIGRMVPVGNRRMSGRQTLVLTDRNGDQHECVCEAFTQTYQVFVLIHSTQTLTASSIIVP